MQAQSIDDLRRQVAHWQQQATGSSSRLGQPALSPSAQDFAQLQAELAYIREECADLRRQLYAYRSAYGPPPRMPPSESREGWEVKPEGQTSGSQPLVSPRGESSDHGRHQAVCAYHLIESPYPCRNLHRTALRLRRLPRARHHTLRQSTISLPLIPGPALASCPLLQ